MDLNTIGLTTEEVLHCNGVAKYMYEHAKGDIEYKQKMYILGYMHLIGKLTEQEDTDFDLLANYEFINEIDYAFDSESKYMSEELELLNRAKMHINSKGERVSVKERLEEIKTLYGEGEEYANALCLAKGLNKKKLNIKSMYKFYYKDFKQYVQEVHERHLLLNLEVDENIKREYYFKLNGYHFSLVYTWFATNSMDMCVLNILDKEVVKENYLLDLRGLGVNSVCFSCTAKELLNYLGNIKLSKSELLQIKLDDSSFTIVPFDEEGKSIDYEFIVRNCSF